MTTKDNKPSDKDKHSADAEESGPAVANEIGTHLENAARLRHALLGVLADGGVHPDRLKQVEYTLEQDEIFLVDRESIQQTTTIHPIDATAINTIDSAVINGDSFVDEDNRAYLFKFLYRWKKALDAPSVVKDIWSPPEDYKDEYERIVCAAVRDSDGIVIQGPRHLDNSMRAQIRLMVRNPLDFSDPDNQGFVNQWGHFLTRKEAWVVAEKRGQIIRRCGGDGSKLYSENLY